MTAADSTEKYRKREVAFGVCIFLLVLLFAPYMYYSFDLYVKGRAAMPHYQWSDISELWKTGITAVIQVFGRQISIRFFYPMVQPYVKDQDNPVNRDRRALKAAKYIYSTTMYLSTTCYGYYILKDSAWLPQYLGGTQGSFEMIFKGAPFTAVTDGASTYAFIQLGFHAGEFINLAILERQNDFMEMLLHHASTFCLIISMIASNMLPIGCVILFLHDIADIPVCLSKFFSNIKGTQATVMSLISFTLLVLSWGFTRVGVLQYFTYRLWTEIEYEDPQWQPYTKLYKMSALLLTFLCILHVYWYTLFFLMLKGFLVSGKAEDTQHCATPQGVIIPEEPEKRWVISCDQKKVL